MRSGEKKDQRERAAAIEAGLVRATGLGHLAVWSVDCAHCFYCGASASLIPAQPGMPAGHRGPYVLGGELCGQPCGGRRVKIDAEVQRRQSLGLCATCGGDILGGVCAAYCEEM